MLFRSLLCAGIVFATIQSSPLRWLASPRSGGVMLRRLLPVAVLTPALIVWARLLGQEYGLFSTIEFGAAAIAAATIVAFSGALLWCAALLDALDRERLVGEQQISRLNAELFVKLRALEVANAELEGFSYATSHVLRAPLRAMDGFSRILEEDYGGKLDDEARRLIGVVRGNARDMSELIDEILGFLQLGRQAVEPQPLDMNRLAGAALESLRPKIGDRRIAFRIADLPSARGDPDMIGRVWLQLLDNAIKFTAPKARATIEVGASPGPRETVYFVRDNGVGFDMQFARKLFGVFNRLHGAEFSGDGMGLAIVQRVVVKHGGRVWAEGRPGHGAVFYFSLPAVEALHA